MELKPKNPRSVFRKAILVLAATLAGMAHGQTLAPLTADGQSFTGYFVNHDGQEWLLIGRGREGWQFDTNGQGAVASVSQNVGTTAAFAPACYSDAIVNDLLAQAGITDMANVEMRLSRASNQAGTGEFQDVRWTAFSGNGGNFTWNIEDSQYGITVEFKNAPAGLAGAATGISTGRNSRDANISNNARRIFTWAWGGHSNQKGFSYGQSVVGADNATTFLWDHSNNGFNHAIPYTEVYIPYTSNDSEPPAIDSTDPVDDATGVYPGADLVVTFDEDIALVNGGTITLTEDPNGTPSDTVITIPDARVTVSGRELTINPTSNLAFGTEYEITIDGLAVEDVYSTPNAYGGTASGEWTFTTAPEDLTAPVITNYNPADDSTGVAYASLSLVATFDDNLLFGSGNITLVDVTNGTDTRVIPIGDPRLSITGNELTITPASNLMGQVEYAVQIDASALTNFSAVAFAGIGDTTTWSFTTQPLNNGVWTYNGNGNWLDSSRWANGEVANGAGTTADFSTINITSDRTVSVNGPVTVGHMLFGDTDDNKDYYFSNSGGGSLTFDGSGTSSITSNTNETHRFNNGATINDTLEVYQNSGTIELNGNFTGSGGITVKAGRFNWRTNDHTYTGPTIIDGGAQIMWQNGNGFTSENPNSNIILEDGIYNRYYDASLTIPLGKKAREIQINGGTSGFSGNRNFNVTLGSGATTLVWGGVMNATNPDATNVPDVYFNPEKLVLTSNWANTYGKSILHNKIDLNGNDRTISILNSNANDTGYGQVNNVISDNKGTGTGLIKDGPGVLYLAHNNTFTGGVDILAGVVRVGHANALGTQEDGGLNFTGGGTKLDVRTNINLKGLASYQTYFGTITTGSSGSYTVTLDQDDPGAYQGVFDDGLAGGTIAFTKSGGGTFTLSDGAGYHTGLTTVSEGGLIIDSDWSGFGFTKFSSVTVASGATFGGGGDLAGDITLQDGAQLFFDPAKTMSLDPWGDGLGLILDLGNLSLDKLVLTGAAMVDDGTYILIDGNFTAETTDLQNFGAANAGAFEGKSAYFDIDGDGYLVLVVSASGPDTSTYTGWKTSHGLSAAADDSDDDGDGISLLMEFALGGDPTVADMSILPVMQMTEDTGNTYLELVVTRPIGLSGITYVPQTNVGLTSWPTDSTGIENASPTPSDNGNGTEDVTYRRTQAISAGVHAFIRLRVETN